MRPFAFPAALDEELERLRQEAQSLVEELEEQLAASATSQRLQDDLDRLDAGAWTLCGGAVIAVCDCL